MGLQAGPADGSLMLIPLSSQCPTDAAYVFIPLDEGALRLVTCNVQ